MELIEFDFTRVTAQQLHDTNVMPRLRRGRIGACAKLFPLVVAQCPPEWGDPSDEATYNRLPLTTLQPVFQLYQREVKAVKVALGSVSFDLSAITPVEFDEMLDNADANDYEKLAAILAKLVKACPGLSGDLHDPQTYLALPFYTHFRPLVEKMTDAGKDLLENFQKPYTAT